MRRINLLSSSILLGLALFVLIASRKFQVWVAGEPGEGFFPVLLGLALSALSAISLIIAYRERSPGSSPDGARPPIVWKKLLSYILGLFAYAIFFGYLGYIVSSLVVLLFMMRVAEGLSWPKSITISLITLFISYLVFEKMLLVPLPRGILEWR
jgi:putative tricarboxylic transport membrane protein